MVTHGKSHTKLCRIYIAMKQRCYNKNVSQYKNYGGRGIVVCNEWLNDFMSFYNWSMNNDYKEGLSIDRIDNNKGYSPDNCRWVDRKVQANNTRRNILLTYNGKTQTIAQWSNELKCSYDKLYSRYKRKWSEKEILFGRHNKK